MRVFNGGTMNLEGGMSNFPDYKTVSTDSLIH